MPRCDGDKLMNEWELVESAKSGEMQALSALLNQTFVDRAITVKVSLQSTCLRILLEADQVPDSEAAIALIQDRMQDIKSDRIQSVQIFGRVNGVNRSVWSETLTLESSALLTPTAVHPPQTSGSRSRSRIRSIDSKGSSALLTGFILAIALTIISPFRVLFHGFLILVHEIGHAATHWLFGRPAIPTVNLAYGGGVTLVFDQSIFVICLVYLAIAFLAYCCRRYRFILVLLGIFTSIYSICLSTSINLILSIFMGHGMELVAIAVCLYLSISGYFCRSSGDRSIYSMLGFFTLFADVQFAWNLAHDLDYREMYEGGIGGVIDNDFVILARDYFNVDLSVVATDFLIGCVIVPLIVLLVFYTEFWLREWLDRMLLA